MRFQTFVKDTQYLRTGPFCYLSPPKKYNPAPEPEKPLSMEEPSALVVETEEPQTHRKVSYWKCLPKIVTIDPPSMGLSRGPTCTTSGMISSAKGDGAGGCDCCGCCESGPVKAPDPEGCKSELSSHSHTMGKRDGPVRIALTAMGWDGTMISAVLLP